MSGGKKKSSPLNGIPQGAWSRGLALARVSMGAGAKAASHALGNLFVDDEAKAERLKAMLVGQAGAIARELGQLKGTAMKAGQMLSMVGEHFLPPEVNELLKSLQSQSPPLSWDPIEKTLKRNLGTKLDELDIEREAAASASLGQVHLATRRSDGRKLALKVQYPGVDRSIESDLKSLRSLLSLAKILPGGPGYDALFAEVKQMLQREVDYERELEETLRFRELLAGDPRYVVPEPVVEYCTGRVLATSWEPGLTVDSPEVAALSQERRDALGRAVLELYFRELFEWGRMQTDPHFGNYRIRLGEAGRGDQIVLYDFGAVRRFDRKFLDPYREMVSGAFFRDRERLIRGAEGMGFLRPEDTPEQRERFYEFCLLVVEPFESSEPYAWNGHDLPSRVAKSGKDLAFQFRLRPPPREVVFLDRKMSGVFIFLSLLRVRLNGRDILAKHLKAL